MNIDKLEILRNIAVDAGPADLDNAEYREALATTNRVIASEVSAALSDADLAHVTGGYVGGYYGDSLSSHQTHG